MRSFGPAQAKALEILTQRPYLLWAHVFRDGGECWPWEASVNRDGYGSIRVGTTGVLAHRAAYFLTVGVLSGNSSVCHRCDTPRCCNPSHLFQSDHVGNMGDMRVKGRRKGIATGEMNGRAKLTTEDAAAIRERRMAGSLLKELAAEYGVGVSTISRVSRGENWT
jgi:hypothetical protein